MVRQTSESFSVATTALTGTGERLAAFSEGREVSETFQFAAARSETRSRVSEDVLDRSRCTLQKIDVSLILNLGVSATRAGSGGR